jgi:hypothetical protein
MEVELKQAKNAHFVTLTYSDENLVYGFEGYPVLNKNDLQLFIKRMRKKQLQKLRYYAIGEYGSITKRPHYHMIVFNLDKTDRELLVWLSETWGKGQVHRGTVTSESISYCTKYMVQKAEDFEVKNFALMSKGIGRQYIDKLKKWHDEDEQRNYAVKEGGKKTRLPRYFRDKIYSQAQKDAQLENIRASESDNVINENKAYFKNESDYKQWFSNQVRKSLKNNDKL